MIENIIQKLNSIPADKVQHFAVGVIVFSFGSLINVLAASIAVVLIAAAKEVYDYLNKDVHTCSFADFIATVSGGTAVLIAVNYSGVFNYVFR